MGIIYEHYQAAQGKLFVPDPAQVKVIAQFQFLYDQLKNKVFDKDKNWLSRPAQHQRANFNSGGGLYLWGDVGRGKTFLMDLFFGSLDTDKKIRLHFRHFMQDIHEELAHLGNKKGGHKDPLAIIARHYANRAKIICLDEFIVEDVSDAMVLYQLMEALFADDVVMIFTSNLAPEELYKEGMHRDRFLPAIELIQNATTVCHLEGDTDHRFRKLTKAEAYFSPVNGNSEIAMEQRFEGLAPGEGVADKILNINHRQIPSLRCAEGIAWFNFYQLCLGPRSSADYIELARRFRTILISGVPVMDEYSEDLAHRFMVLVDEFYDRRVKVVLSAQDKITRLYNGRKFTFEFRRTVSRLMEMQSKEYLALTHRP